MKTKYLIIFIFIVTILLLASLFLSKEKEGPTPAVPRGANFSNLPPGKTTPSEVIRINGQPSSVDMKNGKTYFYYNTQFADLKDLIVFKNDIELYAVENIFEDTELSLEAVLKSFGNYETYYSETDPFFWYVFFEKGVAVQTGGKSILKVIYFIPQSENEFLNSVARDVGLSKETPTPEVLRP